MTPKAEKGMRQAIAARFPLPGSLDRLRRLAIYDLYFGPIYEPDDGEPWPGFDGACRSLAEWADDLPDTLYYDADSGDVSDALPEGYQDDNGEYVEPYLDETYEVARQDIRCAIFGRELAEYVR